MIYCLKFYRIKYQKAGFLKNQLDLSDLSYKLFLIIITPLKLLYLPIYYFCFLFNVIIVI